MNLWCRFGLHRWIAPGFECEQCGYPDTVFDNPGEAERRVAQWRANR